MRLGNSAWPRLIDFIDQCRDSESEVTSGGMQMLLSPATVHEAFFKSTEFLRKT